MTTSGGQLRLRAMSISDLLDETFRLYRGRFPLFIAVNLIIAVPALAVQFISGQFRSTGQAFGILGNLSNPQYLQQVQARQLQQGPDFGAIALFYLVVILVFPFTLGVSTKLALDTAMARPATVGSTLSAVLKRYFGLWGVGLLIVAAAVTCLCPPIGLWLLVGLIVAVPALFEERIGPGAAISRSWSLVRKSWWRVFGIVIVAYLLTLIVEAAVGGLFGVGAAFVPGISADLRGGLLLAVNTLVSVVVGPIFGIVAALLYFDLRVRKESLDLDQMAFEASQPQPEPPAAP